jgi:hypothetical protein
MEKAPQEYLVQLESDFMDEALPRLETVGRVTQILRPRLVLVHIEPGVRSRLSLVPGVLGVYDSAPPELSPDLTPAERLFISAWEARQRPKVRPGDNLPWDAPGFVPPDLPPGRDDGNVPPSLTAPRKQGARD